MGSCVCDVGGVSGRAAARRGLRSTQRTTRRRERIFGWEPCSAAGNRRLAPRRLLSGAAARWLVRCRRGCRAAAAANARVVRAIVADPLPISGQHSLAAVRPSTPPPPLLTVLLCPAFPTHSLLSRCRHEEEGKSSTWGGIFSPVLKFFSSGACAHCRGAAAAPAR